MTSLKASLLFFFLSTPFLMALGATPSGEPTNGAVVKTGKEANRKKTNLEKLRSLKKYSEYADVIKEFGEPDAVVGSGFLIVEYHLQDGRVMRLNFGGRNKLLALSEISKDGAVKHIIKLEEGK
jgi:hypothetical protein